MNSSMTKWWHGDLLLETPGGSYLYGLAHAGSDRDYCRVTQRGRSGQTIIDGVDVTTHPYARFLRLCDKGVPQALECMFSQQHTVNLMKEVTDNYYVDSVNMRETYRRTIRNFWEEGSFKRRRHAVRLHLNLLEAMGSGEGRFNPTLSINAIDYVTWYVQTHEEAPTL